VYLPDSQLPPVRVTPEGSFTVELLPYSVYTLSTAVGQGRIPKPSPSIPESCGFPLPYADNFDGYDEDKVVKYFADQGRWANSHAFLRQ